MRMPRINTNPVASEYELPGENIIEFSNGQIGGLISIKTLDDNRLSVVVYRQDAGVEVTISEYGRRDHQTRTAPSTGDPGRYVAQYFAPEIGRWFDIGDSVATEQEARDKESAYRTERG